MTSASPSRDWTPPPPGPGVGAFWGAVCGLTFWLGVLLVQAASFGWLVYLTPPSLVVGVVFGTVGGAVARALARRATRAATVLVAGTAPGALYAASCAVGAALAGARYTEAGWFLTVGPALASVPFMAWAADVVWRSANDEAALGR